MWMLRWLVSRDYRFRRDYVLERKSHSVAGRKLFSIIFPDDDPYIRCHCGDYADRTRLCERHKVVLSLGLQN